VSECITATCPHGLPAFIWVADGPDRSGGYPWVHAVMEKGARGLADCALMPPATAEEAGEACARCGCGSHGHVPHPDAGKPLAAGWQDRGRGPCECGRCPSMAYRTTALGRELLAARERAA
jgi:hypothetical protein